MNIREVRKVINSTRKKQPTTEDILNKCPEVVEVPKHILLGIGKGGKPKKLMGRKTNKPNSWFTEEKRIEVVTAYAVYGNAKRVEEITGVSSNTIRQWKHSDWWEEVIQRVRIEKDDELDAKFSNIIDKTLERIADSVENGDYIYDTKRGQLVRRPIYAKEGAEILSKIVDKRQLLRGLPTKRIENSSKEIQIRLQTLAAEFEKMVKGNKTLDISDAEYVEVVDAAEEGM